jgi:acyl-CoA thioesterase-1
MTDFMAMRGLLLLLCVCCGTAFGADAPVILVLGDSLGASYGVAQGQGWVALMQQRLAAQGYPHHVVNASVSGDTTAGGLARLPASLDREHPRIVLIELGGNDGFRAQPVAVLRANLEGIIKLTKKAGAKPVLFEMRMPTNYGAYGDAFWHVFAEVAKAQGATLMPFLLNPIALDPSAFQEDGIHPTAASQPKILDGVWPTLKSVLDAK